MKSNYVPWLLYKAELQEQSLTKTSHIKLLMTLKHISEDLISLLYVWNLDYN